MNVNVELNLNLNLRKEQLADIGTLGISSTYLGSRIYIVVSKHKDIRQRRRLGALRVYNDEAKREIQTISALIQ